MSFVPPCYDTAEERRVNLPKLMSLSLEDKVLYSQVQIRKFWLAMKGKTYVSFSGGKDSTVLLDLVRSVYPDTPAVFIDTGLEYPEVRDFVRTVENVTWLRPEKSFRHVVMEEGYPLVSKQCAKCIDQAQRGNPNGIHRMSLADGPYGFAKYGYLVDAPFRVSDRCCDFLKKHPARVYTRETGRCPYLGTRADESVNRMKIWERHGDNREDTRFPSSNPLSIWTEEDVWKYIESRDLPYSSIYDKGFDRTGCIFCGFGLTVDRTRFVRLKSTHPRQWAYCMRSVDEGGLGMRSVLDFMGIPTGCEQTLLTDYQEASE